MKEKKMVSSPPKNLNPFSYGVYKCYKLRKRAVLCGEVSLTTIGQKRNVILLLSFSRYKSSRSRVIRNSNNVAVRYFGVEATAKHTNAASRVT